MVFALVSFGKRGRGRVRGVRVLLVTSVAAGVCFGARFHFCASLAFGEEFDLSPYFFYTFGSSVRRARDELVTTLYLLN
ncbi:UDP-glycosyltransferase 88F3 [Trichinella pseudospiralis]